MDGVINLMNVLVIMNSVVYLLVPSLMKEVKEIVFSSSICGDFEWLFKSIGISILFFVFFWLLLNNFAEYFLFYF